ncbi:MAG: hypothetical protein KAG99_08140 [Bacteroidales bacterium]|nr:hypothetical protein [Bacteroidales bacterium]
MKTKHIILGLFITIIVFSSCREISINTIVNKDGSFTRIVTITGDSAQVFKPDLPYPVDHTWEKEFKKDTTGSDNYVMTYTKFFDNSTLLNQEINEDTSWRKRINRNIIVERKLGFFYSYVVYKETIGAANPFNLLDYKDYISKEDMLWLTGKKLALNSSDSSKIKQAEDTAEEYLEKVVTAEIVAVLKKSIEQLNSPVIDPNQVDIYRDSIALKVNDWNFNSSTEFVDYLAEWTNNSNFHKLKTLNSTLFENLDDNMIFVVGVFEMEDYKVTVELPGIITETNSLSTKGNKVLWNVNASSIIFEDYNMIVESRVVNSWMFIIAGVVLLLLIVLAIFKLGK